MSALKTKILLVMPLVLCAGLAVFYASDSYRGLPADPPVVLPARLDMGEVDIDQVVEATFPIQNRAQRTVRLEPSTPCGCLGVFRRTDGGLTPLNEFFLTPGEELKAVARLRVGPSPNLAYRISFRTDLAGYENVSVEVVGSVNVPIQSRPTSLNWELQPHQVAYTEIHLVDYRTKTKRAPWKVRSTHPAVNVEACSKLDAGKGALFGEGCDVYRLKVKIVAPEDGQLQGELQVQTGTHQLIGHTSFSATVQSLVRLVPSVVVLPRGAGEDRYSARVLCRTQVPCSFSLDKVPSGFQADITGAVLTVRCRPDALPPNGTHSLSILARRDDGQVDKLGLKVTIYADALKQKD